MRQASIQYWTTQRPFVPFVILCSDSARYEIRHPEFAVATRSDVLIGPPPAGGPDLGPTMVPYYHIVRIEPLGYPPGDPSQSNGLWQP